VAAGIRRVVVAVPDPSEVAGGGAELLRRAGVEVDIGLGREAAAALNAPFLWNLRRPDRPFVAVKVAASLDGYLADAQGHSQWISGEAARAYVHWLRAGFDAIAVGRRTADADDPQLTVRGPLVPRQAPRRVIFARSGRVGDQLKLVRTAHEVPTIVVTGHAGRRAAQHLARHGVQIVDAEDLAGGLRALRALGVGAVLVEGGSTLVAELLAEDLVDRVYFVKAPLWLGAGTPAFGPREAVLLSHAAPWVVTERRALGPDTLLVVDRALCLQES